MPDGIYTAFVDKSLTKLDQVLRQNPDLRLIEYGVVTSVGEGYVRVRGLPNVGTDELVFIETQQCRVPGLVYNMDAKEVGVILLDEEKYVEAGDEVHRFSGILSVPVGDQLLGRVVDSIGRPLDGKKPPADMDYLPVERPAPPIMHRAPVEIPLQTGIKIIDALFPIGRGQRELILGDRQVGKTAIAVDTMINQKDKDVICIYCGIGKQKAAVAGVIADLREHGAMDYSIVISVGSEDPVGLQYIAPYSATSIGEYFMQQGKDVLVIYDDLTWHARAYRELALLLRRPPGREAYPGDIFYIHSRLLERSTRLKSEYGGGSLTALPIVETQGQNISAFIPTNLISITDGQLYLSPELFQRDIMPAIDAEKSVSRVGGAAQRPAYRSVTKKLRLAYAQFEELEMFSRFSSRLDEDTRKTIEHGRLIREILKQSQFSPLEIGEQMLLLLAVTSGLFEEFPFAEVETVKKRIREVFEKYSDEIDQKVNWNNNITEEDQKYLLDLAAMAIESSKKGQKHAETGSASA